MSSGPAARQLLKNCAALLQTAERIHVKVPWGYVRGIQVGPQDAPPVLMVHGWLDNCYSFVPLLTELPMNRRYIALDLPGHGHSSHKPKSIILDWVLEVEQIRKALGLEKMSIVGHSMSSSLSVIYSATFPERVSKTVVIDSIAPIVRESNGTGNIVEHLRSAIDLRVNDTFRQKLYPDVDTLAEIKANSTWYKGLDVELVKLIVERGVEQQEGGGVKQTYEPCLRYNSMMYLTRDDYFSFLTGVKCPILWLDAEEGTTKIIPRLSGMEGVFIALNNNISHEKLPGPHHLHMSNPKQVADSIDKFLL